MCAALWTRNLQHGLPSGPARQSTPSDATSRLVAYAAVSWRHGVVQVAATRDGVCAVSLYDDESAFRARVAGPGWSAAHEPAWIAQAVEQ